MFKQALQEHEEEKNKPVLKPIPDGKRCIQCGAVLTHDNLTQHRLKQYIYTCNQCVRERLNSLEGQYRYGKEGAAYKIRKSVQTSAPHFVAKELEKYGTNYELLVDAMKDTEQYRIDRMISIMLGKGVEPKDKKAAINYLLRSFDLLNKQQCLSVINAVHRLIGKPDTPADIKVKLAEELRTFMGGGKSSKDMNVSSYEKMLQEEGEVELE